MIQQFDNISLKKYNTFKIDVIAKRIISFDSIDDIIEISNIIKSQKHLILGEGSNILFSGDYSGVIIKPEIKGIHFVQEDNDNITIKAGAGVIWDDLVQFCVQNNYGGIENLSLIPGTVGACPIQNIGAYGVEAKDIIHSVEFYHTFEQKLFNLDKKECKFGYRDSIFKNELKNKTIIISVTFKLTKKNHNIQIGYGNLKSELEFLKNPSLEDIRNKVIAIRQSKLPDPKIKGNAGSFFKNPLIGKEQFNKIKHTFSDIHYYNINENTFKIPAAWLIEKCGWKGKTIGNACVYQKQPLVLINVTGKASGKEVLELSNLIINDVKKQFGIELQREVNII